MISDGALPGKLGQALDELMSKGLKLSSSLWAKNQGMEVVLDNMLPER